MKAVLSYCEPPFKKPQSSLVGSLSVDVCFFRGTLRAYGSNVSSSVMSSDSHLYCFILVPFLHILHIFNFSLNLSHSLIVFLFD